MIITVMYNLFGIFLQRLQQQLSVSMALLKMQRQKNYHVARENMPQLTFTSSLPGNRIRLPFTKTLFWSIFNFPFLFGIVTILVLWMTKHKDIICNIVQTNSNLNARLHVIVQLKLGTKLGAAVVFKVVDQMSQILQRFCPL